MSKCLRLFVTITEIMLRLPFLYWCVWAFWLVEQLTSNETTSNLAQQKSLLLLNLLQHTFVLLRASWKVWKYLVNWTVRNIFVCRVSSLPWKHQTVKVKKRQWKYIGELTQWHCDIIAHAKQLAKADDFVFWRNSNLLHLLNSETD